MSDVEARERWQFGLEPHAVAAIRDCCEKAAGLRNLWLFGSRARGDWRDRSDIDFAVDAPEWNGERFRSFVDELKRLPMVYPVDAVHCQDELDPELRARIERDRKPFWAPRRHATDVAARGSIQLKEFQAEVLDKLARYLSELNHQRELSEKNVPLLRAMEGMDEAARDASDFPNKAWGALRQAGLLPPSFADRPHSSRFDGAGRAIPNVCLKIPTGGGKTLLAAASVASVFTRYFRRHTGLVLWVVPNEAIYRQTLKALANRDHPYRQLLNVAGAGRVKLLEKHSPLTRQDTDSHLCVMLLMLQSAARQSKETLRFFRDRGNVLGFLPRDDDIEAHWDLVRAVPNLDVYAPFGLPAEAARAQKGSIAKSSLGNVMRLLRPMVVIDEGHHAYTENALRTIDGFNPGFMLELSATPRVASGRASGSNLLVDVRGTDLDAAEMIKLPIDVEVRPWADWQNCLAAAKARLDALQGEADALHAETARRIRPILLVQVERTGRDLRDAGFIHAEDAKAFLLQLGLSERQIAIKTSETNELAQPENIDLLSTACEVRAIVTKQALQEGWDCPFAYVLCALAAGRNLAAMTQLVGRILRMPQVAKTGRESLDACYVLCYDAKTGDVVRAIKSSLESEGMGDLPFIVRDGDGDEGGPKPVTVKRRERFAKLRVYLPRVTWAEPGEPRRELVYDSDVLARVDWGRLDPESLCRDWAPDPQAVRGGHFQIDLSILDRRGAQDAEPVATIDARLDRARLTRALVDLAPNPWLVWTWVDAVAARLLRKGFAERVLAASVPSLIERLRMDLEAERDRLAQETFERLVAAGRIEFRLRADATDYELPESFTLDGGARPEPLAHDDGRPVEKSLFEPMLRSMVDSGFETEFACYLDTRDALLWWHRNVARTQYGLQGWKRHKLYPDFVFARLEQEGRTRLVVLETKGAHLKNEDTTYKRALLAMLSARADAMPVTKIGTLELVHGEVAVTCDLVFDEAWRGTMEARYFGG